MRNPTAFLFCALLAGGALVHAPQARAANIPVTNCNNTGAGSLRNAAAIAISGDTIDLRALGCNPINVTSGQIVLPQSSITLLGRDRLQNTIRGNSTARVLNHTGGGTLRLTRVSLSYGRFTSGGALGGCVSSQGNVELRQSRVHHCDAVPQGGLEPSGMGGGVFAVGNVLLSESSVFANRLLGEGAGGGIGAFGSVTLDRSQVYDNMSADAGGGLDGEDVSLSYSMVLRNTSTHDGGGVTAHGNVVVNKSTLAGNDAGWNCGALCAYGDGTRSIHDSTISGNTATSDSGVSVAGDMDVRNSTIAFNRETGSQCWGAVSALNLRLESTIVSRNTCDGGPDVDVGGFDFPGWTLTGSHNLIGTSVLPVPPDTIGGDPLLAPLANNGGPTRTHAIGAASPAINGGNNTLGRAFDQRGAGFPRVVGGAPDIGAYER